MDTIKIGLIKRFRDILCMYVFKLSYIIFITNSEITSNLPLTIFWFIKNQRSVLCNHVIVN